MANFPFELVAPERQLLSGMAESVELPAAEGDMEVMAGHAPALVLLGPGILNVKGGDVGGHRIFVDGGFCDVTEAGCTVLAESATPLGDRDAAEAIDALIASAETTASTVKRRTATRRSGASPHCAMCARNSDQQRAVVTARCRPARSGRPAGVDPPERIALSSARDPVA